MVPKSGLFRFRGYIYNEKEKVDHEKNTYLGRTVE
jgi:hypothetical protein